MSFLEVKGPGFGIDHPPILAPKLKRVYKYNASAQRPILLPIQWEPCPFLAG